MQKLLIIPGKPHLKAVSLLTPKLQDFSFVICEYQIYATRFSFKAGCFFYETLKIITTSKVMQTYVIECKIKITN